MRQQIGTLELNREGVRRSIRRPALPAVLVAEIPLPLIGVIQENRDRRLTLPTMVGMTLMRRRNGCRFHLQPIRFLGLHRLLATASVPRTNVHNIVLRVGDVAAEQARVSSPQSFHTVGHVWCGE